VVLAGLPVYEIFQSRRNNVAANEAQAD